MQDSVRGLEGRFPRERLDLAVNGRNVPGVLWLPAGACAGLVLACHGGGGHKEAPVILAIRDRLLPAGFAVGAIDGPVHGDRRSDGVRDPAVVRQDFRVAWRRGVADLFDAIGCGRPADGNPPVHRWSTHENSGRIA
ncbi:MAG: hypothetical protein QHC78_10325 [Pigmentiphaga sp.]|uniref:hypothetical protein n=1 Tax=Pigmentiphaga sp. TaxID=1977564 RepID=UPI0029A52CF2|nr:hypothetical protein [Pigmentiphaga sp.]MDX3906071.1 hypothetical protein [Pigmentiphaga sp.]